MKVKKKAHILIVVYRTDSRFPSMLLSNLFFHLNFLPMDILRLNLRQALPNRFRLRSQMIDSNTRSEQHPVQQPSSPNTSMSSCSGRGEKNDFRYDRPLIKAA